VRGYGRVWETILTASPRGLAQPSDDAAHVSDDFQLTELLTYQSS
jgi:hypothetical protein